MLKHLLLLLSLCVVSNTLAETTPNTLTDSEKRSGWKLLFDGKTTDGWRNYKKDSISDGWKVEEGAIVWTKRRAGDIITDKKYGSFELSLDYRISKGGNSGVMFHVLEGSGPPWHTGPEIQVQDNVDGHDPQKAGWLYQLFRPSGKTPIDTTRPAGQWNQIYIRINKEDCEVCVNGARYYQFKLGDKRWDQRVAKSKFARLKGFGSAGEGHICLQDHGNEVAYRNIKIREFNDDGSVQQPIDGKLNLKRALAFPDLQLDQWEPVDDSGKVRPLRLIELTHATDGDNRLFAASQNGRIWTFENRSDVKESVQFLDIRQRVYDWTEIGANEQGLLGLAIHPNYKDNGHLFVYYSKAKTKKSIVSRFTRSKEDPNRADPESELVLMEIDQPFQNHNGGSIEFGPDGYLYIALGDGGLRNDPHRNGQNLSTLLGSILRIDVNKPSDGKNYGIPADNPFVAEANARPEIFAYGMRNPWRMSFDKETGKLWVADVGQELWEEIIVVNKGDNHGWSQREGTHPFGNDPVTTDISKAIDPVWEYDHQIGKSITGGRVYRSDRQPKLSGKYLYADYVTGRVWALSFDENGKATSNEQVLPESIPVLAFGEDAGGEVYLLTSSAKGQCIYRFDTP